MIIIGLSLHKFRQMFGCSTRRLWQLQSIIAIRNVHYRQCHRGFRDGLYVYSVLLTVVFGFEIIVVIVQFYYNNKQKILCVVRIDFLFLILIDLRFLTNLYKLSLNIR